MKDATPLIEVLKGIEMILKHPEVLEDTDLLEMDLRSTAWTLFRNLDDIGKIDPLSLSEELRLLRDDVYEEADEDL